VLIYASICPLSL